MIIAVIDPVIGVLVVALIGPLGAYFVAVRRFSGKIGSSDASQLWEESRAIRNWSKERIEALDQTVARLEARLNDVDRVNDGLARENAQLTQNIRDLSDTITELRAEIVALTAELKQSHDRVEELEDEASDQRPT